MLILARESNLVIRLLRKPGHFVRSGTVVALVWPAARVDERLDEQIRHAFRLGNQRTPTEDVEYAVNQLVEMPYEPCLRRSTTPSRHDVPGSPAERSGAIRPKR